MNHNNYSLHHHCTHKFLTLPQHPKIRNASLNIPTPLCPFDSPGGTFVHVSHLNGLRISVLKLRCLPIMFILRDLRLCPSSLRHGQCPSKMRWRISVPMGLRTFPTSCRKSMEVTHVNRYQVDEVRGAPDMFTKAGLQTSATKGACGLHAQ